MKTQVIKKTIIPLGLLFASILTFGSLSNASEIFQGQTRYGGDSVYPCQVTVSRSWGKTTYEYNGIEIRVYDNGTVHVNEGFPHGETFSADYTTESFGKDVRIKASAKKGPGLFIQDERSMELYIITDRSGNLLALEYNTSPYEVAGFSGIDIRGGIRANCGAKGY